MVGKTSARKSSKPISRDEYYLAFAQVPHTVGFTNLDKALKNPNVRWGLEKIVMSNRRKKLYVRSIPNFND